MSVLVVVAEAEEIRLIPRAYKQLPVLVAGVGARAFDTLLNLSPKVDAIINVGYCGSKDLPIGTVVHEPECVSTDDFFGDDEDLSKPEYKGVVFDMEADWIKKWCDKNNVGLRMIKVVSDNLSYEQYKKTFNRKG